MVKSQCNKPQNWHTLKSQCTSNTQSKKHTTNIQLILQFDTKARGKLYLRQNTESSNKPPNKNTYIFQRTLQTSPLEAHFVHFNFHNSTKPTCLNSWNNKNTYFKAFSEQSNIFNPSPTKAKHVHMSIDSIHSKDKISNSKIFGRIYKKYWTKNSSYKPPNKDTNTFQRTLNT